MEDERTVQKVQDLSDVELAMLLSLIANQHCIIEAEDEVFDALEDEIGLVCSVLHA
jgi:hypothetical protein